MRAKNAMKMLYRSPVRTLLTFILLAAVTFALFSQVMEYTITQRELENAVKQYDGSGTVEVSPLAVEARKVDMPVYIYADERVSTEYLTDEIAEEFRSYGYERITQEQIDEILSLPYVSGVDTRYMTAGISTGSVKAYEAGYPNGYDRIDDSDLFYDFTNTCVAEGTVVEIKNGYLKVDDLELVAGSPIDPYFRENTYVYVMTEAVVPDDYEDGYWAAHGGYAPRATTFSTPNSKYTDEYIENMTVGNRYVFILRYETEYFLRPEVDSYYLTDPFAYDLCDAVWDITHKPANYLTTEEFAPLREYCELIETDRHTFDVVYTENMKSISRYADRSIGLASGRTLTPADTENNNMVCVIHNRIAQKYDLHLNDTIVLQLGNKLFEQHRGIGAVAVVPERLSDKYKLVELRIVGTFDDSRRDELQQGDSNWCYSRNTIFVPKSLLTVDDSELSGHTFAPGEFSFIVNAWDIPAFMEETLPMIEDMGLTVKFHDNGWLDKLKSFEEALHGSMIKIMLLVATIFAATVYVSYLYIIGKRREYAIMRALGTSRAKAGKTLVLPLGALAVAAVAVGTAAAWIYTEKTVGTSETLALLENYTVNTEIPIGTAACCVLGEIAAAVVIAAVMLRFIGRLPPLALLQGNAQRTKTKNIVEETAPLLGKEWVSLPVPEHDGKSRSASFVFRFVSRHIRRTLRKAILCVVVAALLLSVVGYIGIMKQMYTEMYKNTGLVSNYAGSFNIYCINKIYESGYVKDLYYKAEKALDIDNVAASVYITSDIGRVMEDEIEVTYLEGYDETAMQRLEPVVVMGQEFMKERGYKIGDTVEVAPRGCYVFCNACIPALIETGYMRSEELSTIEGVSAAIDELYYEYAAEFRIVGSVTAKSKQADHYVFMPGTTMESDDYGIYVILQFIEATLADNNLADEYHAFGTNLADFVGTGEVSFLMDESAKAKHIKNNIELIESLMPVIAAAVMVIGAFISGILILQMSKDIAIMRVLGTTKKKTRIILVVEQMLLCLAGVVTAVIALAVQNADRAVWRQMAVVMSLYIVIVFAASIIASSLASRKNVLELLQTKE